jgi:hypothetical protein
MAVRTFTAIIHKEDDLYVAECPEVGTVSQGETIAASSSKPRLNSAISQVSCSGPLGKWRA